MLCDESCIFLLTAVVRSARLPLGSNLTLRAICTVDLSARIHGVETPGFGGALEYCSTFAKRQIRLLDQNKSTTKLS